METTKNTEHQMQIRNRENGRLSGVVDVYSFDENQILLATVSGDLCVRGKELHVSRLQLELGEVDVEGQIDSLTYSDHGLKKQKEGPLLARLFR